MNKHTKSNLKEKYNRLKFWLWYNDAEIFIVLLPFVVLFMVDLAIY